MVDIIEKWDRVFNSIANAVFYRTLGLNSLHANLTEVYKYAVAKSATGFGTVEWIVPGYMFLWKNYPVGEGLTFSMRIWGLPNSMAVNTVIARVGWFKANLERRTQALLRGEFVFSHTLIRGFKP